MIKSNNNNKAITHLALPERQIPVLIDSNKRQSEGYFGGDRGQIYVQRLLPSFVENVRRSDKRRSLEKEYGAISSEEWAKLRQLLALKDRINSGDWSPIVALRSESERRFCGLVDEVSPKGWIRDVNSAPNTLTFKSVSTGGKLEIDFGSIKVHRLGTETQAEPARSSGRRSDEFGTFTLAGTVKSAEISLSEAFTSGLGKTRFVVWWSEVAKKFVPGLYCPDIMTALYALAVWSTGTAGGWAICQNPNCRKDFPRHRTGQLYCSHNCQVSAAMRRYRNNLERSKDKNKGGDKRQRKERK